jgi:putative two-component system response regulator
MGLVYRRRARPSLASAEITMAQVPDDVLQALRDPDRLGALYEAELLEATSGEGFDRLTRLAKSLLGVPAALVNVLDDEHQLTIGAAATNGDFGRGQSTPLEHSFCKYTVAHREPLVVRDAREDARLQDIPSVRSGTIVAYLGVPLITREGRALGTHCVIDYEPREWRPEERARVEDLAESATTEIELRTEIRRRKLLENGLEERVRSRTADLEAAQKEILGRLATAAEYRDDATGRHTRRVGVLARNVATLLGRPRDWAAKVGRAAPLHDVGKVGIPDEILLKQGPLSDGEFEVMKRHTVIGGDLLADGQSELVQLAETIARTHHERWDGKGYPEGRAGDAIPLAGQIVGVVDAFDAMTHDRPYRPALTRVEALREIRRGRGSQFAPRVADVVLGNAGALQAKLGSLSFPPVARA